ncbi:uncharacterized protein F5891DRAFT_107882 [Suillus fuscotomentosus]|uniref:Uncharacterized protein n=1 Tax=Suillus fuscotomentosus TaxID=1912939 RepID=A0AAD4DQX7_9AGAM|nr:uncharacterized protein F5891DRAFT_107882 [Suillus fuscotomentosus]KAG1890591.1 hypothetical protein F5891DRAFT_107882 [Suillus fuscotomentosus]
MVSTGMKPAPLGSAHRMQHQGNESAAGDGHRTIPRPTPAEFHKLVSGPQENIIRAMDVSQPVFEEIKKILRDQAVMMLDCERFIHEQVPDIWAIYLDWAREELASFLSKYTDAQWPVELYIEHYLSKKTYAKRHAFRAKITKLRPAPQTARVKSSVSERGASLPPAPGGPPPPYEDHDFVQPHVANDDNVTVENFLKTVNPDISHFLPAFEELGISSEADLVVVRSWASGVRKDFFERELMGKMSALQIQALNIKLGEMN